MHFTPDRGFESACLNSVGVHDVIVEVGLDIHDVFQDLAPRDTGAMARSAHPTVSRGKNGWQGQYVVPVENERGDQYAKFVEFGTRYMRAQNNLCHTLEILEANNR